MSKFLSKLFHSKWLIIGLLIAIIIVIGVLVYLKFDVIDPMSHHLSEHLTKLDQSCQSLNGRLSTIQTQISHGIIVDDTSKGHLTIKNTLPGKGSNLEDGASVDALSLDSMSIEKQSYSPLINEHNKMESLNQVSDKIDQEINEITNGRFDINSSILELEPSNKAKANDIQSRLPETSNGSDSHYEIIEENDDDELLATGTDHSQLSVPVSIPTDISTSQPVSDIQPTKKVVLSLRKK